MKKIFFHIFVCVMLIGLVSCSEESTETFLESSQMTIMASIEIDEITRATLEGDDQNGYRFLWSEGDQIRIYNPSDKQYHIYNLSSGAGSTSGVFVGDELPSGEYIATYGADLTHDQSVGVLSQVQQYASGIGPKIPMSAKVTVYSMIHETTITTFRVATGVIRMNLKGDGKLKEIRIISGDKYISGKATFDANGKAQVKQNSSDGYREVVLNCTNSEVVLTPETQAFYFAMPEGDYSNLTIKFTDSAGDVATKTLKAGSTIKVERSKITDISLTGILTKGKTKATINGSSVDVPWVKLWQGSPKFAEYNVGGSLTNKGKIYSYDNLPSWGSNWRLPTKDELWNDRISHCNHQFTTVNGMPGVVFTGKGMFSNNSIFLPRAGTYSPVTQQSTDSGSYWCTDSSGETGLGHLDFASSTIGYGRGTGGSTQRSVRFVRDNSL